MSDAIRFVLREQAHGTWNITAHDAQDGRSLGTLYRDVATLEDARRRIPAGANLRVRSADGAWS